MFCRSWNSSVYTAGNPTLLYLTATTLGFHKYTHVLFHKYPIPSLRVIYAAWEDQGPGSTHTKYLHFICSVSVLYPPHCAWCRHCQHTPSTYENSTCLKNPFSSAPYWQELTDWRITSERKPFWYLRCGDTNQWTGNQVLGWKTATLLSQYLQIFAVEIR